MNDNNDVKHCTYVIVSKIKLFFRYTKVYRELLIRYFHVFDYIIFISLMN